MAKQKAFTGADGTPYSSSYWRPEQIVLRKGEEVAHVTFAGYKDSAAAAAGKASIGELHVQATPGQFDEFFATSVLEVPESNVYKSCYLLAMATPQGAAFFEGATDV
jgi:hypothetical protein